MDEDEIFFEAEIDEMMPILMASISAYSKIRDKFLDLLEINKKIDEEYTSFAGTMMHFYSSRIQSLTLLLQEWKLWDADILMRSAIECAIRFLYVSTLIPAERSKHIQEFNVDLFEVHQIERSEKASNAANFANDPEDKIIFRGGALTTDQELELRGRWPKTKRKKLKQKWSFSEIVSILEKIKEPTLDLSSIRSIQYSYALGSHFVHADSTAIALVHDRVTREQKERILLERAHFARLSVEPATLLFICLKASRHATQITFDTKEIDDEVSKLINKSKPYLHEFFSSQVDFYNQS